MTTDLRHWRNAKRIFDRLIGWEPERRLPRLQRMRVGQVTRERVLRMLEADGSTDTMLDVPLPTDFGLGRLVGRRVGQWCLEEELGRGGSAVVYRARSSVLPDRVAAVKLLTIGSLARAGAARFELEQRILARLNHPHIAQLYEVGSTGDGTPWLAMALVQGQPIDAWCDARGLSPGPLVRLFLDVCDAVIYAHSSLVIHRDIKPSNVLVDEDGHVRLLDFGIARLVDEDGAQTETQWRMLTPQYAAPEQFGGALPNTTMDVYGLGALLYRLLAGRPPRESVDEIESTPSAPSAAPRWPAAARREIRGDLDRVVLKALALSPAERYQSVADFARDLRHWLARKPVSATRPSSIYRARRFVARNKLVVVIASAVMLALVTGAVASAWQAQRAQQAAQRAEQQAKLAQQEAARAIAVQKFVARLMRGGDPSATGGKVTDIRQALALGAERARVDLAATPDVQAELLQLIGSLQAEFSQYAEAHRQIDEAIGLLAAPDIEGPHLARLRGNAHLESARLSLYERKLDAAVASANASIAFFEQARDFDRLPAAYSIRGGAYEYLGKPDLALADLERAQELAATTDRKLYPRLNSDLKIIRARILVSVGRYNEAHELLMSARAEMTLERPVDFVFYQLLGTTMEALGNWSEAEAAFRKSLELARKAYHENELASPYSFLASFLRRAGQLEEAARLSEAALAAHSRSLPANSPALAGTTANVGVVLRDLGRLEQAIVMLRRASALGDSLGTATPGAARTVAHLALAYANAGDQRAAQHAIAQAQARLEQAHATGAKDPTATAGAYTLLARAAFAGAAPEQALRLIEAAERADSPDRPATHPTVVDRTALRIKALLLSGRALEAAEPARGLEWRLVRFAADQPHFERAETLAILAQAALVRGDYATAARFGDAALRRGEKVSYPQFVETELVRMQDALGFAPPSDMRAAR